MSENNPSFVNIFRDDRNNCGDSASPPALYFPWLNRAKMLDIEYPLDPHAEVLQKSSVVIGGGGLTYQGFLRNLESLNEIRPRHLVAWGLGDNVYGKEKVELPELFKKYDLVGVRDYNIGRELGYQWVPCASSNHPEFDNDHKIEHEVVVYGHKAPWELDIPGMPALSNKGSNPVPAIKFLGSGETIVTNSYHGAFWGTLLGRRVIVVEPFSSKFFGFKHPVPVVAKTVDWKAALPNTQVYPDALAECRTANKQFSAQVQKLFEA